MELYKIYRKYKGPIFYMFSGLLFVTMVFAQKEIEFQLNRIGTSMSVILYITAILFLLTVTTLLVTHMLRDVDLKSSIENLNEAMKSINMGWLISESEVVKIEEKAKEIWVFQNSLEKDYDLEGKIGKTVRDNLKAKKTYIYFLPIHSFTEGQVQSFKNTFAKYKDRFKFILVSNDSIFIHSEIVLYDPTSVEKRNAVEFLPSNNGDNANITNYYVDLSKDRANEIWSLGNKLKKSRDEGVEINTSLFMLERDLLEIESKAEEIWVFQRNLEKEYDVSEGKVGAAVLSNLKAEKTYIYFLPSHSFNEGQVESFEEVFSKEENRYKDELKSKARNKMEESVKESYDNPKNKQKINKIKLDCKHRIDEIDEIEFKWEFVEIEDDNIFIHSEIAIYNPNTSERRAIEWIPAEEKDGLKHSQIYIDLGPQQTKEIYKICKKLREKYGNK